MFDYLLTLSASTEKLVRGNVQIAGWDICKYVCTDSCLLYLDENINHLVERNMYSHRRFTTLQNS